jgi:uncharacterized protein YggT (Ycf19 family)
MIIRNNRVDPATGQVVQDTTVTPTTVTPAAATTYVEPDLSLGMRLASIVYFCSSIVTLLIVARFLMLMFAVGGTTQFANFIYSVSHPLVAPFLGLFTNPQYGSGVLELTDVVALIVYWIAASLLAKFFVLVLTPTRRLVMQP